MKTLALIARRPDLSRDEFRKHYEEVHSPLALPMFEGLRRYVKYHLEDDLYGHAEFDVISTFWYESVERAIASKARFDSPEGDAIREDEKTFMHQPRNQVLPVTEAPLVDGDEGGEGSEQSFVFVKAPDADGDAYVAAFESSAFPDLAKTFPGLPFAQAQQVIAPSPLADLVVQLRGRPDGAALTAWADAEARQGARILAVATRLYESPADASDVGT